MDLASSSNLCHEWAFPFFSLSPYEVKVVSAKHFFSSNNSNVLSLVMATGRKKMQPLHFIQEYSGTFNAHPV